MPSREGSRPRGACRPTSLTGCRRRDEALVAVEHLGVLHHEVVPELLITQAVRSDHQMVFGYVAGPGQQRAHECEPRHPVGSPCGHTLGVVGPGRVAHDHERVGPEKRRRRTRAACRGRRRHSGATPVRYSCPSPAGRGTPAGSRSTVRRQARSRPLPRGGRHRRRAGPAPASPGRAPRNASTPHPPGPPRRHRTARPQRSEDQATCGGE